MPDALDIGIGIFLIGLVIGLPSFNTILIDFTKLPDIAINIMRLGLTAMFVWVMTNGR